MNCNVETLSAEAPKRIWPEHLTQASESGWCWWRDAVLRSAGFPAQMVCALSDAQLDSGAMLLIAAREALDQVCQEALACVSQQVFTQRSGDADAETLRALGRANKALRRREPAPFLADLLPRQMFERLQACVREHVVHTGSFAQQYAAALARQSQVLSGVAADPLFRQAVTWQNYAAIDMALEPLARGDSMPGSKRKQREALVANYLQRYCLKNDTIGFFGPMAWVRVGDTTGRVELGAGLIRSRTVRFEDWTIAALADRLAEQDDVLLSLIPRRQHFVRLEGRQLILPGSMRIELPATQLMLMSACDGTRTVGAIVRGLLANPFSPFSGPAQIFALLRQLERDKRIALTFAVSSCTPLPELALRAHLQSIGNTAVRTQATEQLNSLITARDAVAGAHADGPQLKMRMAELDTLFQALTGTAGRRRCGDVYGGRALVYEDCHRDITMALSESAVVELRRALDLVMISARWFTCEAARLFHAAFLDIHAQLAAGAAVVQFCDFWLRAQTLLFTDFEPIVVLAATLGERWQALLHRFMELGGRRIHLRSEDIVQGVRAAFPSHSAGWNLARYQCPDLMFCAPNASALLDGDFLAVMGEVHLGGNTLATNMFVSQHPDPQAFFRAIHGDLGCPYVLPRLSLAASSTSIRIQLADDADNCIEVLFSEAQVPSNSATAVSISELQVCVEEGRLIARKHDGTWQAPLLDVLGDFLSLSVLNRFSLLNKGAHTPRITIDKLVVQRETWQFAREEITAVLDADEANCFLAIRAWANRHRLPRAMFAKVPWEDKPFFIDFSSPTFVRLFAKQVRRAAELDRDAKERVSLSEMLPAFEELWLGDTQQQLFTSELRVVCLHEDDVTPARS